MFETSVIHAQAKAAPARRLSLLSISIIAHTAVVVGAVAASIATVEFPKTAPDEFSRAPVFAQVRIPPPLGTPEGNNRPQTPQPQQPKPAQPQPIHQVTAPQTTPDTIPNLAAPSNGTSDTSGPATEGTGPRGVPWGDPDSVSDDLDLPLADVVTTPPPPIIYEPHQVNPPVGIYKPQPPYPQVLIKTKMRATVIVRCVIDKNGRVRDAQVIVPALPPFNQSVLDTIATWRFTPGSLNGEAVETYMNLTVNFAVR